MSRVRNHLRVSRESNIASASWIPYASRTLRLGSAIRIPTDFLGVPHECIGLQSGINSIRFPTHVIPFSDWRAIAKSWTKDVNGGGDEETDIQPHIIHSQFIPQSPHWFVSVHARAFACSLDTHKRHHNPHPHPQLLVLTYKDPHHQQH